MLERDWRDFKALYGNIEGARTGFEKACESLFREIYKTKNVQQVEVKQGDGGIDIFIGEIGVSPITVIQCKFFLEEFAEVQYNQIRSSFLTAKESKQYELKEWILCIPKVLDLQQNKWWGNWKEKKIKEFKLGSSSIKLVNGNELIDLFKKYNLYNQVFNIDEAILAIKTNTMVAKLVDTFVPKIREGISVNKEPLISENINNILFNNYTKENELYYFERTVDLEFSNLVKVGNVWVYGFSGAGKTALINRNLIQKGYDYIACDCSPITISNVDDIFEELVYSISAKYNIDPPNEGNRIKQINKLLDHCNINKGIIILIDEISFPNTEVQIAFANSLVQLVTTYNKKDNNRLLKFVISTIPEPLDIIKREKSKASEHFHYLSANDWDKQITQFVNKFIPELKLSLDDVSIKEIIDGCNNSPRLVKNILRKITQTGVFEYENIKKCITEAIRESV